MKHISIFVIALLLVGAGALVYRTAVLTESESNTHSASNDTSPRDSDDHSKDAGHNSKGSSDANDHSGHGNHAEMKESTTSARNEGSSTQHAESHGSEAANSGHNSHGNFLPPSTNPAALRGLDFGVSIAGRMKFDVSNRAGVTVLGNSLDPVSGQSLDDDVLEVEHKGIAVRFSSQRNAEKLKADSLPYLARLSIEQLADGSWKHVNASEYRIAWAERCFHMGGQIDYESDTYLLHRGHKFYFCCWPGECGSAFVENPKAAYGHYGLHEMNGKLMSNDAHASHNSESGESGSTEDHDEHSHE